LEDGTMRENDPAMCEDLMSLTESFLDSLECCPQLLTFWMSDDDENQGDSVQGDSILFAGYWPAHVQHLCIDDKEAQQFRQWLAQQHLSDDARAQCQSRIKTVTENSNADATTVDVLHPMLPQIARTTGSSLSTQTRQPPAPAPRTHHAQSVDNVFMPTIMPAARSRALTAPSVEEAESDWLTEVALVTSLGDCAMAGHNAVKKTFPKAEYKPIYCSGHARLWITEHQKQIQNPLNIDIIHQDFNLAQKHCMTPEASPIVFDLMIKKWSSVLHEPNFALLFNKSWRTRFCPRVLACSTDGNHAYAGIPNHNLGLEGE
jgi:hypothetical protein